ncbi:MAG: aminotransferase class I/II-fold pyridoxal phosphate-dependent enzyme [Acidobacteriota bacterium]|nr:aminotransferase class I/II-fold pyridoxal phosphate-dependent enzyme [Acidobacteriota bacterium]
MGCESTAGLSRRGARLAGKPPFAEYIVEHFARSGAADYVALCIAENNLLTDLVLPRLAAEGDPPARVLGYDAMVGAQEFREQLARFMAQRFLGRRFAAEQIAVLAGAGTVLEDLFYALADPGDAVLVPTPSYAGFWADLETRNELNIVPVHRGCEDGFRLTTERLDAALAGSTQPVRALLFTNPDNPLGKVATAAEITAVLDWAEARGIHVVCDEIYALSVFGATPFTSVASLRPRLGDRVHVVWAFSKDFGASGLRCGLVVSENEALIRTVDGLAYWGAVSGHTQWLLGRMIADDAWVDRFCAELRRRLGSTYRLVSEALADAGIPHVPAEAGIFVVCDLREHMSERTWDAEHALWKGILDEANVNLTPGAACRTGEPGFLRLCYAAEPLERALDGVARVGRLLRG